MTSETLTRGQIYDAASKVVQQALSRGLAAEETLR
jgi:hypothetical protein